MGGPDKSYAMHRWLGFFARNRARAEAPPFTIAGADDISRRFIIRAAGDWADNFVRTVAPGDQFRLGAGVGRFLRHSSAGAPP